MPKIDLLIGGSPCQSFSFAGKRNGMTTVDDIEITTLDQYLSLKNDGFEFQGQSYLFWEYVRLLHEVKPKYFLLENVKMIKKWKDIITDTLGVRPIEINSRLVSAQNRPRLYWTNIEDIPQPKDKHIQVKDIIISKNDVYFEVPTTARLDYINRRRNKGWVGSFLSDASDSIPCLTAASYKTMKEYVYKYEDDSIRFLSCEEFESCQTVPIGYTNLVSKSQRRKMLGNGWTVDVIAHILNGIIKPYNHHNFF